MAKAVHLWLWNHAPCNVGDYEHRIVSADPKLVTCKQCLAWYRTYGDEGVVNRRLRAGAPYA